MASVLNRTTKEYRTSVNTPEFPVAVWIIEPDLSAVAGFANKYWTITGDIVTLMTASQRAAVDAAELSAARDTTASNLDGLENIHRAAMLVILDEVNLHAQRFSTDFKAAVAGAATLAALKTSVSAIPDVPQRSIAQLKTALRAKLGS